MNVFFNCVLLKGDIHATIQFKGVVNEKDNTIKNIVAGMKTLLTDNSCIKVQVTYMNVKENNK
jgi:hypothetical protein